MAPSRVLLACTLAMLAAAPSAAKPAHPTVNITLGSHFYRPNPIYLAGGVPTRLIFENKSGKTHDFKAPEFFRTARIMSGSAPGGVITLQRGRGAIVTLIPRRGRYKVHCSQPFHTMLGMTATIIVS